MEFISAGGAGQAGKHPGFTRGPRRLSARAAAAQPGGGTRDSAARPAPDPATTGRKPRRQGRNQTVGKPRSSSPPRRTRGLGVKPKPKAASSAHTSPPVPEAPPPRDPHPAPEAPPTPGPPPAPEAPPPRRPRRPGGPAAPEPPPRPGGPAAPGPPPRPGGLAAPGPPPAPEAPPTREASPPRDPRPPRDPHPAPEAPPPRDPHPAPEARKPRRPSRRPRRRARPEPPPAPEASSHHEAAAPTERRPRSQPLSSRDPQSCPAGPLPARRDVSAPGRRARALGSPEVAHPGLRPWEGKPRGRRRRQAAVPDRGVLPGLPALVASTARGDAAGEHGGPVPGRSSVASPAPARPTADEAGGRPLPAALRTRPAAADDVSRGRRRRWFSSGRPAARDPAPEPRSRARTPRPPPRDRPARRGTPGPSVARAAGGTPRPAAPAPVLSARPAGRGLRPSN
ncbi:basic salivary proline-rich protein 4-like [Dipodomys merriami]|uniref:basic salivary proline-rich protein 4-like n=1 Tax=Dipodomys merriami TaxID=94247 RepID=UPI00384D48B6